MIFRHFLMAVIHVILSLLLGMGMGIIFTILSRFVKSDTNILIMSFGFVLVAAGFALYLGLSDLLCNMAMGAALMNFKKEDPVRFFDALKRIDWLFYLYFFVLTGAGLEIPLLKDIGLIGLIYLIARPLGEYIGAFVGATIGKMPKRIRNLIGLGLVPQAGVALGLAILVRNAFSSTIGHAFLTTIVATTIIYEIVGPFFTKLAIKKAGEISS